VGLNLVHLRSTVFSQEKTVDDAFDQYQLFRDSYLQRRSYLINDGEEDLPDYDQMLQDVGSP
jgi:ABC-type transporter lipoprotein component MlaA